MGLDDCDPVRLQGCFWVCLWVQLFSHWHVDYAICDFGLLSYLRFPLSLLVSCSSHKRRLGVLVLVLTIFLGEESPHFSLMADP